MISWYDSRGDAWLIYSFISSRRLEIGIDQRQYHFGVPGVYTNISSRLSVPLTLSGNNSWKFFSHNFDKTHSPPLPISCLFLVLKAEAWIQLRNGNKTVH